MKAAYITQTGPAEVIQYGDLPEPAPVDAQVLVKVEAVSVNPIDVMVRAGIVEKALPSPYIIGADLAGEVIALGPDAARFTVGDRVWGCTWHEPVEQGTFAEYVCTDEKWLYPLPNGVRAEQAAALALVGITAHLGLVREARLQRGECLFVNGGSGGVGSAVVQMAKGLGARVLTTAGDSSKAERCRQLGADVVIRYKEECLQSALEHHASDGIDVWLDVTRAPDLDLAVNALAPKGRLVVISGREARSLFPVGPFYVKCCRMSGFQMTLASAEDRRSAARDINRWVSTGRLKANIDRVLPMSQAAEAHRLQETSTLVDGAALSGKIVLEPDR